MNTSEQMDFSKCMNTFLIVASNKYNLDITGGLV